MNNSAGDASSNWTAVIFQTLDSFVEVYLGSVITPYLTLHETFHASVHKMLRTLLNDNPIASSTAFITYGRTALVVPTVLLLVADHSISSAVLVATVFIGEFVERIVAARYGGNSNENEKEHASMNDSDKDSFEIVTRGSHKLLPSWTTQQQSRVFDTFLGNLMDKVFVVPCWIALLHVVPTTNYLRMVQFFVLWFLVVVEVLSSFVCCKDHYRSSGFSPPKLLGPLLAESTVTSEHVRRAQRTLEMAGTALYVIPWTRYLGLGFLVASAPLAYESIRRSQQARVVYVPVASKVALDHRVLRFWMQAASFGTSLIVGVPGEKESADSVLNARACQMVDQVVSEAPSKVDLMFLERYKIDYVVLAPGQLKSVTDEVVQASRCLHLAESGEISPVCFDAKQKQT